MSGGAQHDINNQQAELQEGDWILLKSGVNHSVANALPTPYSFFNIHFDLDDHDIHHHLGGSAFRIIPKRYAEESKLDSYVASLEELMQHEIVRNASIDADISMRNKIELSLPLQERLHLHINALLIIQEILLLLDRLNADVDAQAVVLTSAYETDIAHTVEARLSADLAAPPSIATIAKELNISRSQCSRIFSKVYGISPRQYLSRLQLRRAKELLTTSNLSIQAIADRLGFSSVHHFSRQFRRWTSVSPNQYRRGISSH